MTPQPYRDGPGRLWSLWDIMQKFYPSELFMVCMQLNVVRLTIDQEAPENGQQEVVELLERAKTECERVGFLDCAAHAARAKEFAVESFDQPDGVVALAMNLYEAMLYQLTKRSFLYVGNSRARYLDNEQPFGQAVAKAFPTAKRDLTEAGNCLAAENTTAAVFHLMRAAEVVLRILAIDRCVTYPNATVESKQVGDLIGALDGKLREMRLADKKLWPNEDTKNAQLKFYHDAVVEFRDFNEAWRRHMAHSHAGAFYDRNMALSIMNHVENFMKRLADKISESSTTPEYWQSA